MKEKWGMLIFIVFLAGAPITLFMVRWNIYNAIVPGGVTLAIMLVCSLMAWRNEACERTETQHKETMKMLYGIYKATSRE